MYVVSSLPNEMGLSSDDYCCHLDVLAPDGKTELCDTELNITSLPPWVAGYGWNV